MAIYFEGKNRGIKFVDSISLTIHNANFIEDVVITSFDKIAIGKLYFDTEKDIEVEAARNNFTGNIYFTEEKSQFQRPMMFSHGLKIEYADFSNSFLQKELVKDPLYYTYDISLHSDNKYVRYCRDMDEKSNDIKDSWMVEYHNDSDKVCEICGSNSHNETFHSLDEEGTYKFVSTNELENIIREFIVSNNGMNSVETYNFDRK